MLAEFHFLTSLTVTQILEYHSSRVNIHVHVSFCKRYIVHVHVCTLTAYSYMYNIWFDVCMHVSMMYTCTCKHMPMC